MTDAAARMLAEEAEARLRTPAEPAGTQAGAAEAALLEPAAAVDAWAKAALPNAALSEAEKNHNAMWAIAMVKEASEIDGNIPSLPPAHRGAAILRSAMLSATANDLLTNGATRRCHLPGVAAS